MILFSFSVKAKEVQLLCLYASSSKESQLRTLVGNCSETCNQALYCSRESNKVCMQEEGHTTKCIKENQIYFVLELLLVVQELKRTQRSDDRSAKFLISLWFVSKLLNLGFLCNFFSLLLLFWQNCFLFSKEPLKLWAFYSRFLSLQFFAKRKKYKTFLIKSWDMTEPRNDFLLHSFFFQVKAMKMSCLARFF